MSWKNDSNTFGVIAKTFHWLSALIVLGMLPLGYFMVSLEHSEFKFSLFMIHKSFGLLLFFLVWLRLVWRLISPRPDHLETHQAWETKLAKLAHFMLYVGMIGMPLTGILQSMAADYPVPFFKLFTLPDLFPGKNREFAHLMGETHSVLATVLLGAVALHGAGAFKHHFIDKDVTLTRMLLGILPKLGAGLAVLVFVLSMVAVTLEFALLPDEEEHERKPPAVTAPVQPAIQKESKADPANNVQAVPALATKASPGDKVARFNAPQWEIVPQQSRIGFKAKVEGADFEGQFTSFDGDIFFNPDHPEHSFADITVDIASVQSASTERDQYIVDRPWLYAESFPKSRLQVLKITKTAENQYVAMGMLTLRDVSRPVTIPFTLTTSTDDSGATMADMQGSFSINRLDFGVGTGEWSKTDQVANALSVTVSLKAQRMDGAPH